MAVLEPAPSELGVFENSGTLRYVGSVPYFTSLRRPISYRNPTQIFLKVLLEDGTAVKGSDSFLGLKGPIFCNHFIIFRLTRARGRGSSLRASQGMPKLASFGSQRKNRPIPHNFSYPPLHSRTLALI